jgi:hypothetical protein
MRQEEARDGLLRRASGQVPSGRSAVVAEIAEFGQSPLEARMHALGGLVVHEAGVEAEYQVALGDLQEIGATMDEAWAAYEAMVAGAAATREARLAGARARLAQSVGRLKQLDAYVQAQIDDRVARLRQQAEQADPERRAALEREIAQTRGDHKLRRSQIEAAWHRTDAALAR